MGTNHCCPDAGRCLDVDSPPAELEALTGEEIAACLVGAAVWAPSLHNTQPWLFGTDGQELRLYADGGRQLMVADPAGRQMLISCGAALFTARLALRSAGRIPQAQILPDPADPLLIARLAWPGRAAPADHERQLFGQVLRRRTHRGGFDPLPLAPALLAVLQAGARRDGAQLRVITDQAATAALAATVQTAEQTLRADSLRVQETAAWVSPPASPRRDGLPATSYTARPPAFCSSTATEAIKRPSWHRWGDRTCDTQLSPELLDVWHELTGPLASPREGHGQVDCWHGRECVRCRPRRAARQL